MTARVLTVAAAALAMGAFAMWVASGRAQPDRSPSREAIAIRAIVDRAVAEMQTHYPLGERPVLRDAHAKAHGCARGLFTVDPNLADDLRVATFARPGAKLRAWVRFSNGAFAPGSDAGLDGRGMALKLIAADGKSEHDILAISYPQFFSPDAFDYLDFAEAGALTGDRAGLQRYFVPGANPFNWRLRQGVIAYRIASQDIGSPLSAAYFSMAAFRFGPDRAVKFALKPCEGVSTAITPRDKTPDYLRRALVDGLARGPACFKLFAQFRGEGMSVDDATQDWPVDKSPFRELGELTMFVQKVDASPRDALCENLRFTPWRAPAEFEPLGGLNRARRAVYDAISEFRHDRNNVPVPDPAQAWDSEGSR